MKSTINLYKNLPLIDGNYIIDDIEEYLNQFSPLSKEIDIVYINLFNDVFLNYNLSDIETLKEYNYVKITSDEIKTAYYFITNIEKAANNNIKFSLELDVLNTYNNLEFYSNTLVEREHIDRWNYKGYYYNKNNNKIFLLRNFKKDQDELQPLSLIANFNFYSDLLKDSLLDHNYWVKINIKDESDKKEGIKIYFLNLFYDFSLAAGDIYKIKALTSYSNKEIAVICQTASTIINWSIVPYCPHPLLKNVGQNDLIQSTTEDFFKIFNIGTLEFSDDQQQKYFYTGIATTFYGSLLPLSNLELPLYKIANNKNQLFFTDLMNKIFIQKINDADSFIKKIKANNIFINGVFSQNHDEERDINNFYQTNEPSTLKNNNLQIIISFEDQFKHTLLLENIKIKDNINLNEFYNTLENLDEYKNIFILPYFKLFYDENGGSFIFKDSDYFYYKGFKKKGYKIKFFSFLPLITSEAIEYEKQAELKRLQNKENYEEIKQDETVAANPSIFRASLNFISDKARIAQDFVKKNVPKNIQQGFKRGLNSLLRTGNPFRALGSATTGVLFNQEQENNKQNMANTSFESFINNNEFKIELDINMNEKMNTLEDLFYYYGNLINVHKIPTHNNRKYFDYLKCDPVFKTKIPANSDIKDKIIDLFNIGVYYIHKTIGSDKKNQWVFPYENIENFENKLINLL